METAETIAIVDDKQSMRLLVNRIVTREGWRAESFASGDLFLGDPGSRGFAVVLLDLRMPGTGGLGVLEIMAGWKRAPPVIVLTGHGGISEAVEAMKIGAFDFLQKPFAAKDLIASITAALSGAAHQTAVSSTTEIAVAAVKMLSPRQLQVLRGIVFGDANKVIAYRLSLSTRTVEAYRAQMLDKLGVRNTTGAVRLAIAAGLDCAPYAARVAA